MNLQPGETAIVRRTAMPVTIIATSKQGTALVRTRFGGQWSYRLNELDPAPEGDLCPI